MAKQINKRSRNAVSSHTAQPAYPAVSVIIPMYNAEKYINDCLDSVLAQTFTNFEVLVIDDCSTDNSPAIVESYREKFGGRLTYVRRKKNFGGAAMSRNMGISLARGEYIQLLDNDDFLTKTALEELYTLAKDYDADVVYTAARYIFNNEQVILDKSESFTDKPTLEVDAAESLLQRFFARRSYIFWTPWLKFVRRNFLIRNEISFPATCSHEDLVWTIELLCCAKKFVNVPNPVYRWRLGIASISHKSRPISEQIKFWASIITKGIYSLDNLRNKYDVLKKNTSIIHSAIYWLFDDSFGRCFQARMQLQPVAIYEMLRSDFADDNKNLSVSYIPYLYSLADLMQKQLIMNQQRFNQFAAQAQKRIAELEAQLKTK